MRVLAAALSGLFVLGALLSPSVEALDIVVDGTAAAVIVVPDDPLPVVMAAAQELQGHIALATGATLPLREEREDGSSRGVLYVGACRASATVGLDASGLAPNGYRIKNVGGNLYFLGDDSAGEPFWILHNNRARVGTLFAVYDYLEQTLQARWLWPGPLGTTIDRTKNLRTDHLNITGGPPFIHARWRDGHDMRTGLQGWASSETRSHYLMAQGKWLRRHRFAMGRNMDMAHAFTQWWDTYGESHPEYFNLLPDGTRRSDPFYYNGRKDLIGMSVGDPAFHRAVVEDWLATRTEEEPDIDCSENDTHGKCLCETCLALDEVDPTLDFPWEERVTRAREAFAAGDKDWVKNLGSLSDRYARYYLAVQEEARKHDPEALVMGYAYVNYEDPPRNTPLNDHIIIGIVPSLMFPWADEGRARMRRQWDGWSATGARLFLRPNYMLDGHNLPINFAEKLGSDFRHAAANGLVGTDFDSINGQWATQGPNLYMLGRLHIDPTLEAAAVLAEYYNAFGPARDAVAAYFDHWARITDSVSAEEAESLDLHWSYFYRNADAVYTPTVLAEGRALLEKARVAASDDRTTKARVDFLEAGLRNVELTLAAQAQYREYKSRGELGGFRDAVNTLDAYRATIEKDFVANMAYLASAEGRTWDRRMLRESVSPEATMREVPNGANLLTDGGFEEGARAWGRSIMEGNYTLDLDDATPFAGKRAARIVCTDTPAEADGEKKSWARWHQGNIAVDTTKSYRLQCRVRTSPDYTGVVKVWVAGTKSGTMEAECMNTSGDWRVLALDAIAPAGGEVAIYLNAMAGAGTVCFDTVALMEDAP